MAATGPDAAAAVQALEAAGVYALAEPTLNEGETYQNLLDDRSTFEDYDVEAGRTRGYGFARIQRLALEHLLGVRSGSAQLPS